MVLTYALKRLCENFQLRIGIISETDALATAFMREIKRTLERNSALIDLCGVFDPGNADKWNEHEMTIAQAKHGKDVSIFALGMNGQVTGRRADLLIFDDIESSATVNTSELRTKTRERLAKEIIPMLEPDGEIVAVGTRKHHDDVYKDWINSPEEWLYINNALTPFETDGESVIWPDRWPYEALMSQKATLDHLDLLAWSSEYLNNPIPSSTQMFDPVSWPTYSQLPNGVTILQAWDLAISSREQADYTVCATIGIDHSNNIYLIDVARGHWSFHTTQEKILELGLEFNPTEIGIEASQYQSAAVQEALRNTMLPIRPLLPRKVGAGPNVAFASVKGRVPTPSDKVSRARLLESRAASGKVYRPERFTGWWQETAEELAYFPKGSHDDIVDALSYAVLIAQRHAVDWSFALGIVACDRCSKSYIDKEGSRSCPYCGKVQTPRVVEEWQEQEQEAIA